MKHCKKCGVNKPLEYYHQDRRNKKDGKKNVCMQCCKEGNRIRYASDPERAKAHARSWREKNPEQVRALYAADYAAKTHAYAERSWRSSLKRNYGITLEDYYEMLEAQGNVCGICKKGESGRTNRRLSVDHDHATRMVHVSVDAWNYFPVPEEEIEKIILGTG